MLMHMPNTAWNCAQKSHCARSQQLQLGAVAVILSLVNNIIVKLSILIMGYAGVVCGNQVLRVPRDEDWIVQGRHDDSLGLPVELPARIVAMNTTVGARIVLRPWRATVHCTRANLKKRIRLFVHGYSFDNTD